MDLTPEQWLLIQPLLPPQPEPGRPGRPHLDQRHILDGILWRHRNRAPWHSIPSRYGSHQVCYLYFKRWQASGLMDKIFQALLQDLQGRGKFNIEKAIKGGVVRFVKVGARFVIYIHFQFAGTWQVSTSLLVYQKMAQQMEEKERGMPSF